MNLYQEFYPLAVEMLDEFGAAATLTTVDRPGDALAAKRAGRAPVATAPVNRSTRAVVGPVAVQGADGRKEMRTLATMLAEPLEGDKLAMGDLSWVVGAVTRLAPQGKAIVFMAEVS